MRITALFVKYKWDDIIELNNAVDEYTQDDNPEYLRSEIEKVKKNPDIKEYRLININIPFEAVQDAFERPEVTGKVEESK